MILTAVTLLCYATKPENVQCNHCGRAGGGGGGWCRGGIQLWGLGQGWGGEGWGHGRFFCRQSQLERSLTKCNFVGLKIKWPRHPKLRSSGGEASS